MYRGHEAVHCIIIVAADPVDLYSTHIHKHHFKEIHIYSSISAASADCSFRSCPLHFVRRGDLLKEAFHCVRPPLR